MPRTCTKCLINKLVTDNGHSALKEWMFDELAVEVFVAVIIRVDGHGAVAQHRLNPSGGHDNLII